MGWWKGEYGSEPLATIANNEVIEELVEEAGENSSSQRSICSKATRMEEPRMGKSGMPTVNLPLTEKRKPYETLGRSEDRMDLSYRLSNQPT